MNARIIIAGAGHGGLVAAILLARHGFDVSLYEKCSRDGLGHDWHDDFFLEAFDKAGLPRPAMSDYTRKTNTFFYSPNMKHVLSMLVPEDQREIQMDRKTLYARLLANADEAGVKSSFNSSVTGPLLRGNPETVRGITMNNKEIDADLVIDATGMNSPIRHGLPANYCIEADISPSDVIYTYRAYYQLRPGMPYDPARFNLYFLFGGIRGIAWFRIVDGQADVFFGQVEHLSPARVEELLQAMRNQNPALGEIRTRGGQYNVIPVRRPLARLVGDGYAATGDAACMTIPLNGSGIYNAFVAGKLLAETVMAAGAVSSVLPYTARALWPYQANYYNEIGARMAGIEHMKHYLLVLPPASLDFIFSKHLITEQEIIAGITGAEIKMGFKDLMGKLARGFPRLPLLLSLKKAVDGMKTVLAISSRIPPRYDPGAIESWEKELARSLV
jgi:flavin-dependent dehydrogenase